MSWSKVLAWLGFAAQILNLLLGLVSQFAAIPGAPPEYQAHAVQVHFYIGVALGLVQAFLKSLRDENGNGIPDLFETPPKAPGGA